MKQTTKAGDDLDDVLDDFGRHPGVQKRVLYGVLGSIVALAPVYLCVRIFVVDVASAQLTLGAGVAASGVLLGLSYHNLAFSQSARLRAGSTAPSKNSFKGRLQHYDKALQRYEARVSAAALAYSFAYNNAIFLLTAPFCASYVFADKVSGELNALCSGVCAAALALFNSRSALKAIGE